GAGRAVRPGLLPLLRLGCPCAVEMAHLHPARHDRLPGYGTEEHDDRRGRFRGDRPAVGAGDGAGAAGEVPAAALAVHAVHRALPRGTGTAGDLRVDVRPTGLRPGGEHLLET